MGDIRVQTIFNCSSVSSALKERQSMLDDLGVSITELKTGLRKIWFILSGMKYIYDKILSFAT